MILLSKETIRVKIKEIFKNIDKNTLYKKSEQLKNIILKNPIVFEFKTIGFFVGGKYEPETVEIIKGLLAIGKEIYIPKIINENKMIFCKIKSIDELKIGKFNILEPINDTPEINIELFLIPGLAFTKEGKRLGKGKGYYDQYFGTYKNNYKIGICFDFQIIDDFKDETHDIKMNEILYI